MNILHEIKKDINSSRPMLLVEDTEPVDVISVIAQVWRDEPGYIVKALAEAFGRVSGETLQ